MCKMLLVAIFIIGLMMLTQDVSSFATTSHHHHHHRRSLLRYRNSLHAATPKVVEEHCSWSPQDLTANNPGCIPIPDDDYIKKYQSNSELWPVEFFVIAYRRFKNEIQILVRRSPMVHRNMVWAREFLPHDGYPLHQPRLQLDINLVLLHLMRATTPSSQRI